MSFKKVFCFSAVSRGSFSVRDQENIISQTDFLPDQISQSTFPFPTRICLASDKDFLHVETYIFRI